MTRPKSLLALLLLVSCAAAGAQESPAGKPKPHAENVRYGPHERNVLDLWLAKADGSTPLVLFIHGGGFRSGDKSDLAADRLKTLLDSGFSVASLNYRLTDTAPMPAAYLDAGRALQFLRANAAKWNLDPKRVASTGISAGAATSMWLAFHDDLADPRSDDTASRPWIRASPRRSAFPGRTSSGIQAFSRSTASRPTKSIRRRRTSCTNRPRRSLT
jgi:acetyl esterase/lipase